MSSRTFGLYPKNYPRSVAWAVDCDYTSKLPPAEREWLAAFLDGHYGGKMTGHARSWSPEDKRESYRRKNSANRDVYSTPAVFPAEDFGYLAEQAHEPYAEEPLPWDMLAAFSEATPVVPQRNVAEEQEVVEAVGIKRTKQGWGVVLLRVQGNRLLSAEVVAGPRPSRAAVLEDLKLVVGKRLAWIGHSSSAVDDSLSEPPLWW